MDPYTREASVWASAVLLSDQPFGGTCTERFRLSRTASPTTLELRAGPDTLEVALFRADAIAGFSLKCKLRAAALLFTAVKGLTHAVISATCWVSWHAPCSAARMFQGC